MRCGISMSCDLTTFLIVSRLQLHTFCNMPSEFYVNSSWIFSAPLAHLYLLCVDILKIAYDICIKVPLTLNCKILSVKRLLFQFLWVVYFLHTKKMYARCSACFTRRRHFALYVVMLVSVKWNFNVVIEDNPMKLLQYDGNYWAFPSPWEFCYSSCRQSIQ